MSGPAEASRTTSRKRKAAEAATEAFAPSAAAAPNAQQGGSAKEFDTAAYGQTFVDAETGEESYSCDKCSKMYTGKNARSIWRRHLQDKHQVPLSMQPRKSRWDSTVSSQGKGVSKEERRQRTLESKRRWARKNRAEKRALKLGLPLSLIDDDEDLSSPTLASYPSDLDAADSPEIHLIEEPQLVREPAFTTAQEPAVAQVSDLRNSMPAATTGSQPSPDYAHLGFAFPHASSGTTLHAPLMTVRSSSAPIPSTSHLEHASYFHLPLQARPPMAQMSASYDYTTCPIEYHYAAHPPAVVPSRMPAYPLLSSVNQQPALYAPIPLRPALESMILPQHVSAGYPAAAAGSKPQQEEAAMGLLKLRSSSPVLPEDDDEEALRPMLIVNRASGRAHSVGAAPTPLQYNLGEDADLQRPRGYMSSSIQFTRARSRSASREKRSRSRSQQPVEQRQPAQEEPLQRQRQAEISSSPPAPRYEDDEPVARDQRSPSQPRFRSPAPVNKRRRVNKPVSEEDEPLPDLTADLSALSSSSGSSSSFNLSTPHASSAQSYGSAQSQRFSEDQNLVPFNPLSSMMKARAPSAASRDVLQGLHLSSPMNTSLSKDLGLVPDEPSFMMGDLISSPAWIRRYNQ